MSYTKRFIVALCLVLCLASAAFCIDPYKANKGGFGPKIKGLQLGQKMSLAEIVGWGIAQGRLPFNLNLNYEAGQKLSIEVKGKGDNFETLDIKEAEGRYVELKNFSGKIGDLLSEIEKLGFNGRGFYYIQFFQDYSLSFSKDMRIAKLFFIRSDFGADAMTPKEFVQAFINAYHIPGMDGIDRNTWRHRNLEQGWQVTSDGNFVKVEPIITQSAFD